MPLDKFIEADRLVGWVETTFLTVLGRVASGVLRKRAVGVTEAMEGVAKPEFGKEVFFLASSDSEEMELRRLSRFSRMEGCGAYICSASSTPPRG